MQINEHAKIYEFSRILKVLIQAAQNGTKQDIDFIMTHLNSETSLPITRYVDFAVSLVIRKEGINQLKFYLLMEH